MIAIEQHQDRTSVACVNGCALDFGLKQSRFRNATTLKQLWALYIDISSHLIHETTEQFGDCDDLAVTLHNRDNTLDQPRTLCPRDQVGGIRT